MKPIRTLILFVAIGVLIGVMGTLVPAQWERRVPQEALRFDGRQPHITVNEWTDRKTRQRYLVFAGPTGIAVVPAHTDDRVNPWRPIGEGAPLTQPEQNPDPDNQFRNPQDEGEGNP